MNMRMRLTHWLTLSNAYIPSNAALTQPYWLANPFGADVFSVPNEHYWLALNTNDFTLTKAVRDAQDYCKYLSIQKLDPEKGR